MTTELFKKIRRIQFQTTHLANDVLAGAYLSAFKGKGMEFEDVREYQPGDDIRTIDWNVTARMQKPFIKRFQEERELTLTLVVDISASNRYGTKSCLKNELIAEVAGVLAFSAIKNNDKVSLLLFSDKVEKYLPPKKGTRHVLRVIRELLAFKPQQQGTNISEALKYLGKVQQRASICFLISDFICPDFSREMAVVAQRHDLISIAIIDPSEKELPKMNLVNFVDLETGQTCLIDTSDVSTQEKLKKSREQRLAFVEDLMKHVKASLITLYTDRPYLHELRKFFKIRAKRRL
ncbi:MAG: DUF58 domain-containing protein [Parachlamydiaceae bacterium]|nr:DUF58 domain-containing protein [Parachlamydiaceae bacterium]